MRTLPHILKPQKLRNFTLYHLAMSQKEGEVDLAKSKFNPF